MLRCLIELAFALALSSYVDATTGYLYSKPCVAGTFADATGER